MLVAVDEIKVEVFSRQKSGKWLYEAIKGLDASIDLPRTGPKPLDLSMGM